MEAWFPAILAGMAIEAATLSALWRRTGRGVAPAALLPGLAAGAALIGAAWTIAAGAWWPWSSALLLSGGALHVVDVRGRWVG